MKKAQQILAQINLLILEMGYFSDITFDFI